MKRRMNRSKKEHSENGQRDMAISWMWGRIKEMEESKKALYLHTQVWEDGISMTREKDVRDTPTGGGRGRVVTYEDRSKKAEIRC